MDQFGSCESWEEWCKLYPVIEAVSKPDFDYGVYQDRPEAERVADKLEEGEDGWCFKVVKYKGAFYIVSKDTAEQLSRG